MEEGSVGRSVFLWSMLVLAAFLAVFLSVKSPHVFDHVSSATSTGAKDFGSAIIDSLRTAWTSLASNFHWG